MLSQILAREEVGRGGLFRWFFVAALSSLYFFFMVSFVSLPAFAQVPGDTMLGPPDETLAAPVPLEEEEKKENPVDTTQQLAADDLATDPIDPTTEVAIYPLVMDGLETVNGATADVNDPTMVDHVDPLVIDERVTPTDPLVETQGNGNILDKIDGVTEQDLLQVMSPEELRAMWRDGSVQNIPLSIEQKQILTKLGVLREDGSLRAAPPVRGGEALRVVRPGPPVGTQGRGTVGPAWGARDPAIGPDGDPGLDPLDPRMGDRGPAVSPRRGPGLGPDGDPGWDGRPSPYVGADRGWGGDPRLGPGPLMGNDYRIDGAPWQEKYDYYTSGGDGRGLDAPVDYRDMLPPGPDGRGPDMGPPPELEMLKNAGIDNITFDPGAGRVDLGGGGVPIDRLPQEFLDRIPPDVEILRGPDGLVTGFQGRPDMGPPDLLDYRPDFVGPQRMPHDPYFAGPRGPGLVDRPDALLGGPMPPAFDGGTDWHGPEPGWGDRGPYPGPYAGPSPFPLEPMPYDPLNPTDLGLYDIGPDGYPPDPGPHPGTGIQNGPDPMGHLGLYYPAPNPYDPDPMDPPPPGDPKFGYPGPMPHNSGYLLGGHDGPGPDVFFPTDPGRYATGPGPHFGPHPGPNLGPGPFPGPGGSHDGPYHGPYPGGDPYFAGPDHDWQGPGPMEDHGPDIQNLGDGKFLMVEHNPGEGPGQFEFNINDGGIAVMPDRPLDPSMIADMQQLGATIDASGRVQFGGEFADVLRTSLESGDMGLVDQYMADQGIHMGPDPGPGDGGPGPYNTTVGYHDPTTGSGYDATYDPTYDATYDPAYDATYDPYAPPPGGDPYYYDGEKYAAPPPDGPYPGDPYATYDPYAPPPDSYYDPATGAYYDPSNVDPYFDPYYDPAYDLSEIEENYRYADNIHRIDQRPVFITDAQLDGIKQFLSGKVCAVMDLPEIISVPASATSGPFEANIVLPCTENYANTPDGPPVTYGTDDTQYPYYYPIPNGESYNRAALLAPLLGLKPLPLGSIKAVGDPTYAGNTGGNETDETDATIGEQPIEEGPPPGEQPPPPGQEEEPPLIANPDDVTITSTPGLTPPRIVPLDLPDEELLAQIQEQVYQTTQVLHDIETLRDACVAQVDELNRIQAVICETPQATAHAGLPVGIDQTGKVLYADQ